MTREIKFRGRTPKGEWLYGDLQHWSNGDVYIGTQDETWTDDGFPRSDAYLSITKVNEDTVGQFTGLHDKNGKDLYEGDVISCRDEGGTATLLVVEFGIIDRLVKRNELNMCRITCFYYRNPDTNECLFPVVDEECPDIKFEILGNVYDNPELLKGGNL